MNTYAIHEDNLDRLEKHLTRIQNKCKKYGSSFHYAVVGEEFREYKLGSGETNIVRYVLVEAEGQVIHNDWEFIAVVEHTEAGNIIRQHNTDIEVPEKYRTTEPVCEHCNTKRRRKDTYLIYNQKTQEWKQVGKTCLCEFTQGMDAEEVARYISLFHELIKGEAISGSGNYECYHNVKEVLQFALETVKHFGYQKWTEWEPRCTKERCMDYFRVCTGRTAWMGRHLIEKLQEEMDYVKFNAYSEENDQMAADAIEWVKAQEENDSYMHNLKVICSSEYCAGRDLGILISLGKVYRSYLRSEEEKEAGEAKASKESTNSEYVGVIGERIEFTPVSAECVYSNETMYGWSWLYKFVDEKGNVYMWWSSSGIDQDKEISTVKGTVKSHEEYKGVKQTFLTRCRVTQVEKTSSDTEHAEGTFNLDQVLEVFNS